MSEIPTNVYRHGTEILHISFSHALGLGCDNCDKDADLMIEFLLPKGMPAFGHLADCEPNTDDPVFDVRVTALCYDCMGQGLAIHQ